MFYKQMKQDLNFLAADIDPEHAKPRFAAIQATNTIQEMCDGRRTSKLYRGALGFTVFFGISAHAPARGGCDQNMISPRRS